MHEVIHGDHSIRLIVVKVGMLHHKALVIAKYLGLVASRHYLFGKQLVGALSIEVLYFLPHLVVRWIFQLRGSIIIVLYISITEVLNLAGGWLSSLGFGGLHLEGWHFRKSLGEQLRWTHQDS